MGLITNITSVQSLDRAEREILVGVSLDRFWPIQDTFVAGEQLCELGIPSGALITLLRIIY